MPRLVILRPSPVEDTTCIEPTIGAFGQRIYDSMEPVQFEEPKYCWPFKKYVGAQGEIFQEIDTLARDGPAWSSIVDIDRCPDYGLLWLAQLVGVRVPNRFTPTQQRDYIRATPNWKRGTPSAIEGATKLHLTGTKAVYIVERYKATGITDPNTIAYTLQVNTLTSETPDPDTTLQDILTQKPAAIILNYRVILGQTYQHLYDTSANYNVVYSKYATYNGVFDDVPGE